MTQRTYQHRPEYAAPPGYVLQDHIEAKGLTPAEFARQHSLTEELVADVIKGSAPIDRDLAALFGREFSLGADVWLRMESRYRRELAEEAANRATRQQSRSQPTTIIIDRKEIIRFFDEKPPWAIKHATAVVAVMGEDLAAAAFQHCLLNNGASKVTVRTETVGPGGRKGPRLDRWIEVDWDTEPQMILFQTEIKNLSAHSTGAKALKLRANKQEVNEYKHERWTNQWDTREKALTWAGAAKVLVPMKPPKGTEARCVLPLLIYWTPIAPGPGHEHQDRVHGGHLFTIPNPKVGFKFERSPNSVPMRTFPDLWVFSVSSYLRSLDDDDVALEMPTAAARLHALQYLTRVLDQ